MDSERLLRLTQMSDTAFHHMQITVSDIEKSRAFYGGYVPNTTNQLNNRVWFQSVVARLVF